MKIILSLGLITIQTYKIKESLYITFLGSADLSRNFPQLIMSIFIFSQYFFQ